jgi:ribosomal protein S18 acetylase RimI-like enzyme
VSSIVPADVFVDEYTVLRPATAADVAAVAAITEAAYEQYRDRLGGPAYPTTVDHAADVAAGGVVLYGRPAVGLLKLAAYPDHLLLESIAVLPHAAGQGIGRVLLAFVEVVARRLGAPEIRLYTHVTMVENQRLYSRFGYEALGRSADEDIPRVHFRKPVVPG